MKRDVIAVEGAPRPLAGAPYSQAIRAGGLVFCAGQLGLDPADGSLVDGGVAAQARRALESVSAILDGAGSSLDRVVKTTVFLADMGDFGAVNEVYAAFFPEAPPARSAFQVAALPAGGLVEIEVVALA